MDTQLIVCQEPAAIIEPADAVKDRDHRLTKFAGWLSTEGRPWHRPDLAAYRDGLLSVGYAPSTIGVHLATVRARHLALVRLAVGRGARPWSSSPVNGSQYSRSSCGCATHGGCL